MKRRTAIAFVSLLGCGLSEDIVDFGTPIERDDRPVVEAEIPPPPISGGTLIVTDDVAVAADSDRDRVYVVDLEGRQVKHTVALARGAEPGRVVQGASGRAHVLLRGSGDVASIDLANGKVAKTRSVCTDPRGIAHDAAGERLFVACADGILAELPEDPGVQGIQRRFVEPDLRDVLVRDDQLLISRFRSAQVLVLALEGETPLGRWEVIEVDDLKATSLWRMIAAGPDTVVALHQYARRGELPIASIDPSRPKEPPYGGDGKPPANPCQPAAVGAALTTFSYSESTGHFLSVPTPAVDVAIDEAHGVLAVAVPAVEDEGHNIDFQRMGEHGLCEDFATQSPGQAVSVAYTSDARLVVQSREPATVNVHFGNGPFDYAIPLDERSVFDSGHDMFHRATEAGLACASCHAEGADDGNVWLFEELGPRRTQPLDVGLEGSEPFHWDGDIDDIAMLTDEVFHRRMGGMAQPADRVEAFERWLFSLERPAAATPVDPVLADEGYALFHDFGCVGCHTGSRMSNDATVEIDWVSLQVPSLRRVGVRPPYMHDGRAPDLRAAIGSMATSTLLDVALETEQIDALEAFLRTR